MAFTNNVMIVRHGLLAKLVKLWKENRLLEEIDRLPIELSPRKSKVIGRCCVHKERAVWKYKTLPLLGFDMQDEVDELTPLSEYAKQALLRSENKKENLMCVVDEACSSCVQVNYEITNLCRGCVARSCYMNCPKDAIRFKKNGQAEIDHDTCISCGKCHQNCPYHAIVYIPIPCEEVCPVKAISKDEYGVEHIDESKCIYCGKCVNACPFGAIFEISQVFDILQRLRNKEPMVAIVAPSILAQFAAPVEKVYGAIKSLGFLEVVEVAQGAMETTRHEAEELKEKLLRELDEKDNKLKEFFRLRVEMIKEFVELSRKYGNNLEKLKDKFSRMVSTDSFSPADWILLKEGVNIMGNGIIDHLQKTYPELTEENLRYCALICAGFETDELAILWDINNDSIYKRRTRLRQKLGLAKTQDIKKFFDSLITELRKKRC